MQTTHYLVKKNGDRDHLFRSRDGIRVAVRDANNVQLSLEPPPNSFNFLTRQFAIDFMRSVAHADMLPIRGCDNLVELLFPNPQLSDAFKPVIKELDKTKEPEKDNEREFKRVS